MSHHEFRLTSEVEVTNVLLMRAQKALYAAHDERTPQGEAVALNIARDWIRAANTRVTERLEHLREQHGVR